MECECLRRAWLHDPLDPVANGCLEPVEALDRNEDPVGIGLGVAEVAEGEAGFGVGDRTRLVVVGDRDEVAHGQSNAAWGANSS